MSKQQLGKVLGTVKSTSVEMVVFAMDHVAATVIAVTALLFVVGSLLFSVPVGLLAAMFGSMVVLYGYVGFCQSFADYRGSRHA